MTDYIAVGGTPITLKADISDLKQGGKQVLDTSSVINDLSNVSGVGGIAITVPANPNKNKMIGQPLSFNGTNWVNGYDGYADLIGTVTIRTTGDNIPGFVEFIAPIFQYQFDVGDYANINYHIPHDFANEDMFIHVHYALNTVAPTGFVKFQFEVVYANGYDRGGFNTVKTISVEQAVSSTRYGHMIAEVQLSDNGGTGNFLDTNAIEVDGIILCKITRVTATGAAASSSPFIFFIDIHYKSSGQVTQNKNYPFWS